MGLIVQASGQSCGAQVTGIDLSQDLGDEQVAELRSIWLEHLVLSFPGQSLDDDGLERFTQYFGPFGNDPYVAPIAGRDHVIAIERSASESSPVFAESWHSDWSFQERPPAGTCLLGLTIPPTGGDTLFVNQQMALDRMPDALRSRIEGMKAVHSARSGYAPTGLYGDADADNERVMQIKPSAEAMATQLHSLVHLHPETGVPGLFGCLGYIIGVEGLEDDRASELLVDLYHWQTDERFQYRHVWDAGTLVMWDNRSTLHRATGGYDGHERLLHRTTIGAS